MISPQLNFGRFWFLKKVYCLTLAYHALASCFSKSSSFIASFLFTGFPLAVLLGRTAGENFSVSLPPTV